jgi:hypothetical protein
MRRLEDPDGWGLLSARGLEPIAVQTLRDAMKDTPVMANQMLSVGGTIWDWGIPLGIVKLNPFEKIKDLEIPDRGHVPWPAWVVEYISIRRRPGLTRPTASARAWGAGTQTLRKVASSAAADPA